MHQNIASVDFKEIKYKEKIKTDKSIINQDCPQIHHCHQMTINLWVEDLKRKHSY